MFQGEILLFLLILIGLVYILTVLFLYLIIQKAIENARRRKINQYKKEYQSALFKYINEGIEEKDLRCSSFLQMEAFIELLEEFISMISSVHFQRKTKEFAETHFQELILKKLKHSRWSIRMNALFLIEDFQMEIMMNNLSLLYKSKALTKGEEIQILKIYARFDHPDLYNRMVYPKHPLTEFEYNLLFRRMSEQTFERLYNRFSELPKLMKYSFIESIGTRNQQNDGQFLKGLLEDDSSEVRIRALKAMVTIGFHLEESEVIKYLQSAQWQERLMAIKICDYIRSNEFIPYLLDLLSDSTFYVRSQAAKTLLRMENGLQILNEVAATNEDPFARDMAEQWIERGPGHDK